MPEKHDFESAVFSPAGSELLGRRSRDKERLVRILIDGERTRVLGAKDPFKGDPSAIAPGGRIVASDTDDGIVLWDLGTGRKLHTIAAGKEEFAKPMFAPDGTLLAITGTSVLVWRIDLRSLKLAEGEELLRAEREFWKPEK